MKLTTNRVQLLSRLGNRVKRGTITTHEDWFVEQCDNLSLDFDKTMKWLFNEGIVRRMTRKSSYPVIITIYKD